MRTIETTDGITIIERAGSTWEMGLYCSNWLIDGPTGMRCHTDNEISHQLTSGPCEELVGINEASKPSGRIIYPNPGTTHFSLSLSSGPHSVNLFDATGRLIHQQRVSDEFIAIDTALLPSGIYLVKVDEGTRPLRWVKE